jgi:transcriptional regulator NrdR family protein
MQCPSCSSTKILTYDTRRVEDKVVRKRRCTNCEERFYTLEQYMSEEELEEVQELKRKQTVHDPRSKSQSEGEKAA